MIYWYDDLYMDQPVRREEEKCRKTIGKRSFWQKLPWKKSYYIIMLANNRENLFEIMSTSEMFFRYYGYTDIYIIGVSRHYKGAVELLRRIMTEGYRKDIGFDPRQLFRRERFQPGKTVRR